MPSIKINLENVKTLVCPDRKVKVSYWDSDMAGFIVTVYASGSKTYFANYQANGVEKRVKIGKHGELTPDQARREAKRLLGLAATGGDPQGEKQAARAMRTFKAVGSDFIEKHMKPNRSARASAEYERLLEKHIYPAIGTRRIIDIVKRDISKLHISMRETPSQANQVVSIISSIFSYAEKQGEFEGKNPAKGIVLNPERKVERYLTGEELARLGDVLQEAVTIGLPYEIDETKPKAKHAARPENRLTLIDPYAVAALRLLLLTGARLHEILDGQWADIDLERGVMWIAKHKTVRTTGKKALVLNAPALEILNNLPRIERNPHIIPGALEGQPRSDLNKPWAAIRRAAGLEDFRLHDLRHSFASFGAGSNMGLPLIGKLLGHANASTTQRYAHLDHDPLRRASDSIGAQIMAGLKGVASGNVVAMKRGKKTQT